MRFMIALMAVAVAGTAFAAENPDIAIYLDMEPPTFVHEVHPGPNDMFDVYVCLFNFGPGGGTRGTAFLFERTFGGFKIAQAPMLGGLDFGDVEVDGWTIAAGADCVYPDAAGVVILGIVDYLYTGPEGTITILPHPGTGRHVLDCDYTEDDSYCVHANLGVSMPPPPGEPGCPPLNPVEDATWGGIKSLYR